MVAITRWLMACVLMASALTQAAPPLVAGTSADEPPVTFMHEGEVSGIEADFARILAAQTGREVRLRVMPDEELIPALQRGEIDLIMSGLTVEEAQAAGIGYARPYTRVGQMLVIRTADVARFSTPLRILRPGVRIGYEQGSAGERFLQDHGGLTDTVAFANAEAGLDALLAGRIDAFLHDAPTSWHLATQIRYGELMSLHRPLTEQYLAWGVREDDEKLRAMLNDELERMRQTGSLEHVLNRWIPVKIE